MKIIKKGNLIEEYFFGECPNCGCQFEAEKHEVVYDMNSGGVKAVCPMDGCRASVFVTQKKRSKQLVPIYIQQTQFDDHRDWTRRRDDKAWDLSPNIGSKQV